MLPSIAACVSAAGLFLPGTLAIDGQSYKPTDEDLVVIVICIEPCKKSITSLFRLAFFQATSGLQSIERSP
eukprot:2306318-Amphidinium_carterae.1